MAEPADHRTPARTGSPRARALAASLLTALLTASTAPVAQAQADESSCPNQEPPPAVDSSEVPAPGEPEPSPLPIPPQPVGGAQLGECGFIAPSGAPDPPADVDTASWILADLDSGEVLAAHNPHGRQRPASTIKVLTALLTVRELDMSEPVEANQDDADAEGSKVGLEPDVTYTVGQVLSGLLLQSGNDAAHALGRKLGGQDVAAERMTRLANRLGAHDTRVATPSGLDGPGMSTSAYDLALLYRAAMREPDFARTISTEHTQIPGPPDAPPIDVWSNNQVLLNYPGGIGGKTGFTNDARHTFIGAAKRDGRRLVTVLMRGEQHPVPLATQSEQLLDYGFEVGSSKPVGQLVNATSKRTSRTPAPNHAPGDSPSAVQTQHDNGENGPLNQLVLPLTLAVAVSIAITGTLLIRRRRARSAEATGPGSSEHGPGS